MPGQLEEQLRELANRRPGAGVVDDLELRHLVSVILHGALVVQDLYVSERIETIYSSDPRSIARSLINPILHPILAADAQPRTDLVMRTGHLPDEVRLVGDKCLFDVGISGIRRYRGSISGPRCRAYRMAPEVPRSSPRMQSARIRRRNRLAPLPLAREVLSQAVRGARIPRRSAAPSACWERLARQRRGQRRAEPSERLRDRDGGPVAGRRPRADARASAPILGVTDAGGAFFDSGSRRLTRDELLAAYERIICSRRSTSMPCGASPRSSSTGEHRRGALRRTRSVRCGNTT
jgi:hypothetical protein